MNNSANDSLDHSTPINYVQNYGNIYITYAVFNFCGILLGTSGMTSTRKFTNKFLKLNINLF